MKTSERLNQVIARRHLLNHPFYQAWTRGELSIDTLRDYAAQYFVQVDAFPRFVSSVHRRCPDIAARKVLLENLVDEEIKGTDHPELWLRFAEGLGVSRDAVKAVKRSPTTQAMAERFYALTAGNWVDGLCALYAYESQVPAVSESKIEGLEKHYGITAPQALQFFKAHMVYDVEHSNAVAELIDLHADPQRAEQVTADAADALYRFLDGFPVPTCAPPAKPGASTVAYA